MLLSSQSLNSRRWIDALLALSGVTAILAGHVWPGVALLAFAAVTPALRLGCGPRAGRHYDLVPEAVADAHQQLVAAARLPGVDGGSEVIDAADDTLIEVAALLCGRPPRGRTQQRFVDARVAVLRETTVLLQERHLAWSEAKAELDELSPIRHQEAPREASTSNSVGVRALVVLFFPVFVLWDLLAGAAHAAVAFVEGTVLRMRAVGRLGLIALGQAVAAMGQARAVWRQIRNAIGVAAGDARVAVKSARLRTRLQLRRATRSFRQARL